MDISYTLIRSGRKTISMEIRPDGTILVRAPRRMSVRSVEDFVRSKENWLRPRLEKIRNRPDLPPLSARELEEMKNGAKACLPGLVAEWAARVGVSYGRVTIRAQKSRWGSCSARGNLNFNCLLMVCPPEVRDYVVIHELCHRKHMNHSPAFWTEVARFCPDFPTRKQWLKENGARLIGRIPR